MACALWACGVRRARRQVRAALLTTRTAATAAERVYGFAFHIFVGFLVIALAIQIMYRSHVGVCLPLQPPALAFVRRATIASLAPTASRARRAPFARSTRPRRSCARPARTALPAASRRPRARAWPGTIAQLDPCSPPRTCARRAHRARPARLTRTATARAPPGTIVRSARRRQLKARARLAITARSDPC